MSTIRTTITESLTSAGRASYLTYAEPVIAALEEREDGIKADLLSFAQSKGLGNDEVEALFVQVGLSEPAPEPEVAVAADSSDLAGVVANLATQVQNIATQIQTLTSAAARYGVRV